MHTYKDAIRGVKTAVILYPTKILNRTGSGMIKSHAVVSGLMLCYPGLNSDNLKKFIKETVLEID